MLGIDTSSSDGLDAPGAEKQKTAHASAAFVFRRLRFGTFVPHIERFIAQAP
jgi:hypothetical protein